MRYAELLTRDIHGVSEAEFQKTRSLFNDSQIVELTMTTCFFNYFLRYCEGANLPVEKWALDEPVAKVAAAKFEPQPARVALVSDDQMSAVTETLNAAKTPANNWNIGIANSQRAFLLAPEITIHCARQSADRPSSRAAPESSTPAKRPTAITMGRQ